MDSITQIVLGATCAKAVIGKNIGNKSLFFGAIAITILVLNVFIRHFLYNI
jgi:inner membrane protein